MTQRVRITHPRMGARLRPPERTATHEIDEQTLVGEVYLSALLRAQLRAGLSMLGMVVLVLAGLPVLFLLLPDLAARQVGPLTVAWLLIGVAVFPALWFAARWQVRAAERVERDFSRILRTSRDQ